MSIGLIYKLWVSLLYSLVYPAPSKSNDRNDGILRQDIDYRWSAEKIPKSKELVFQPLRVHIVYKDSYYELDNSMKQRLHRAVGDAVSQVSQLFHVVPVQKPLLLRRHGCHKVDDKGHCVLLKRHQTEVCGETFVIPEDHLDSLYLWNETYPHPIRTVYTAGPGIGNTDFVLYVESTTTDHCLSETASILSYTKLCQVDQNDRPIAGYINVCPQELEHLSLEKLYKVAIHELFHLLGFSRSHFGYFKRCQIKGLGLECGPLQSDRVKEIDGKVCMVTPAVMREAKDLFRCLNDSKICVQLDAKDYEFTSHWDKNLMNGSIMTTSIESTSLAKIDRITLAVFEDSGWYKVNYSHADQNVFRKGKGCSTQNETCFRNGSIVCKNNGSVICDSLHRSKAVCHIDKNTSCREYRTYNKGSCISGVPYYHEEVLGEESACFMSNISNQRKTQSDVINGRCYQYNCTGKVLKVKVRNSKWIICPYGNLIKIPGYSGFIRCPSEKSALCHDKPKLTSNVDITIHQLATSNYLSSTIKEIAYLSNNGMCIGETPSICFMIVIVLFMETSSCFCLYKS